jgi:hypothetical protein
VDGKQIYDNFRQGDTQGLQQVSESVNKLSAAYLERAQGIKSLQERMKQAWTGDAADAANAGAGPLEQAFAETAAPLDVTKASVDTQAAAFDHSSNSVVQVPPKPDKPNPWTTGLKAAIPIAGPFMAQDDIDSYQEGMAKYNAANETNVRVMDQYSNVTSGTMATLPTDYGVLESDGAAISVSRPQRPGTINEPTDRNPWEPGYPGDPGTGTGRGGSDHTSTSSVDPGRTGGADQPGGSGRTDGGDRPGDRPGGTDRPAGTDRPGATDDTTRTTRTPVVPPAVRPGDQPADRPGKTPPPSGGIDFYPTSTGGGSGQNYSTTFGEEPGTGPGGRGPNSGNAGGRLLDSTGRGGTGTGGGGAAGERGPGGGGRSGMGSLGNAAAAEAAAARSAAGRSGAMGPMGAGGRRGEGEEDDEHQRPDFLIEADPDAIFGTDQRTSPPVIGE